MNDPNGLFFVDGSLHVTYQHNPDGPHWGCMRWGHAATRDMLAWEQLPTALSPRPDGPDSGGCWSGSIIEAGGRALAFYTGMRVEAGTQHQRVCRAISVDPDRVEWRVDPDDPVIAEAPKGIAPDLFRDPFLFEDGDGWVMLVGGGTTRGHGAVLRYRSDDLERWEFDGRILASSDLAPTLGADGPMWECPQFIRTPNGDMLIVSVVDRTPGIRPSHVTAIVGRMDPDRFHVDHVQQLGMGPDFYAPAVGRTPDDRWLLFGWIPEDPPEPGSDRDWAGALTFPRIVALGRDGRVSLSLAEEVAAARIDGTVHPGGLLGPGDPVRSPTIPAGPFEARITLEPLEAAAAVVELRDSDPTPLARIAWRASDRVLTLARRGIVGVAGRNSLAGAELPPGDGPTITLRCIVDGSILELETNGHAMATARLPGHAAAERGLSVWAVDGQVRVHSIEIWPLVSPGARGAQDAITPRNEPARSSVRAVAG